MSTRFCKQGGCHERIDTDARPSGYCAPHEQKRRARHQRFVTGSVDTTSYDIGRPVRRALYDRHWQRERAKFLAEHPYCVDCIAEGRRFGLASEVDHEIPHRGDRALFWDESNWRPRCKPHHSRKTAREVALGGA